MSGAPPINVLRAVRVHKSGSPQEGLFPPRPAHSPWPGASILWLEYGSESVLADAVEWWQGAHRFCGPVVGITRTWPLAGAFGHYLASLRVVGHSRRSRWSAGCGRAVPCSRCRNGTGTAVACRGPPRRQGARFRVLRRGAALRQERADFPGCPVQGLRGQQHMADTGGSGTGCRGSGSQRSRAKRSPRRRPGLRRPATRHYLTRRRRRQ